MPASRVFCSSSKPKAARASLTSSLLEGVTDSLGAVSSLAAEAGAHCPYRHKTVLYHPTFPPSRTKGLKISEIFFKNAQPRPLFFVYNGDYQNSVLTKKG